jgi:hypothetical protein
MLKLQLPSKGIKLGLCTQQPSQVGDSMKKLAEFTRTTECGEAGVYTVIYPRWDDITGETITRRAALEAAALEYGMPLEVEGMGGTSLLLLKVTAASASWVIEQYFAHNC